MEGRQIKNYVFQELLGKGGMGSVYLAQDTTLERQVAIKVLPEDLMRNESRRRRFVQEAKSASAVTHPAIAQIYEVGQEAGVNYIVMEYIDGSTVRDLIKAGELDVLSALEVGILTGEALAKAHEAGIIHRDIKSDNIMITRDGHPKILDFGLAKLLEDETTGQDTDAETVTMTQAGMVMGTVAYMSPEQARGLPVDKRSDVFSFGIVLYEMATGQLPFEGQSALDTMHAIAFQQTRPIATLRGDLPYSLQRVVDRCLMKDPEQRYSDMREAVSDLKQVKREMQSGVTTGIPVLDRLRVLARGVPLPHGLNHRGRVFIGVWGVILIMLTLTVLSNRGGFGGVFPFAILAFILYGHFRGRREKQIRRFAKKASKIKEVRLVSYQDGGFIVVAEKPKAKTYLKLNALLGEANSKLYDDPEMTMTVKEDPGEDEVRNLVTSTAVRYVRDA